MKHGKGLPVALVALLLLTVAMSPASATEAGDDDGCQGLTTALLKVKNERARTAIQANLDARGCEDDGLTAQSACETLSGDFYEGPLVLPGLDWACVFWVSLDVSVESGIDFLLPFCASGNTTFEDNRFNGVFYCWG